MSTAMISHLGVHVFGALIVFFLDCEPHACAAVGDLGKEKPAAVAFPH